MRVQFSRTAPNTLEKLSQFYVGKECKTQSGVGFALLTLLHKVLVHKLPPESNSTKIIQGSY
jgi:hypothetical protein